MMREPDVPVVVVGAGLAGLVTAYELWRHGIECLVLERSSRIGGRVHTVTFDDGAYAEAHMEEFWAFSPAYSLLDELGLEIVEDIAHSSMIRDGTLLLCRGAGRRDPYLESMFTSDQQADFLRWNSRVTRLLSELDRYGPTDVLPTQFDEGQAISFADFVTATTSSQEVADWIRVVVESETAVEWSKIGSLDGIAEMRPFLDAPGRFGYPNAHVANGNERFTDALASSLAEGSVVTQAQVDHVRDEGSRVVLKGRDRIGRPLALTAHQAVITVPSWSLRNIALDIDLSAPAHHALSTARAGSYVKVILRLRADVRHLWAPHEADLFTLLSDSPAGCIYLDDAGDERDLTLTCLVHGAEARRLCHLRSDSIVRAVVANLELLRARTPSRTTHPLFPGLSGYLVEARAYAYPHAVAYWPVSERRSRFDVNAVALRSPHGRVHFAGDTTECSHSDGAVRSGQRVAATVAERLGVSAASLV